MRLFGTTCKAEGNKPRGLGGSAPLSIGVQRPTFPLCSSRARTRGRITRARALISQHNCQFSVMFSYLCGDKKIAPRYWRIEGAYVKLLIRGRMSKSDRFSTGKGSIKKTTEEQLRYQKMTRKKHFGYYLSCHLYFKNEQSAIRKSYRNTMYCASVLMPTEKGLRAKYCKNRWCPTCQSIRIAKLICGYASQLDEMCDPYFVTLTAPTVSAGELEQRIKEFGSTWRLMTRQRYWKEHKPNGIRKAECTLRPEGQYHYHYHVIIDGREHAEWLINQWLKRVKGSNIKAQDMRQVRPGEYIEIFKYFTKLISTDKLAGKEHRYIDFERLNVVFETLKGTRVYQPFGKIKPIKEEIDDDQLICEVSSEEYLRFWRWMTGIGYVSNEGEILAGDYELPSWVEKLCGKLPEGHDSREKEATS